jgi:hypothetical protein
VGTIPLFGADPIRIDILFSLSHFDSVTSVTSLTPSAYQYPRRWPTSAKGRATRSAHSSATPPNKRHCAHLPGFTRVLVPVVIGIARCLAFLRGTAWQLEALHQSKTATKHGGANVSQEYTVHQDSNLCLKMTTTSPFIYKYFNDFFKSEKGGTKTWRHRKLLEAFYFCWTMLLSTLRVVQISKSRVTDFELLTWSSR